MAKDLFPPTDTATRPLTSNAQRQSNIVGPIRYPEMGGFTGPSKVSPKSPFKQTKPGVNTR